MISTSADAAPPYSVGEGMSAIVEESLRKEWTEI